MCFLLNYQGTKLHLYFGIQELDLHHFTPLRVLAQVQAWSTQNVSVFKDMSWPIVVWIRSQNSRVSWRMEPTVLHWIGDHAGYIAKTPKDVVEHGHLRLDLGWGRRWHRQHKKMACIMHNSSLIYIPPHRHCQRDVAADPSKGWRRALPMAVAAGKLTL
jgi:hypothetical protein